MLIEDDVFDAVSLYNNISEGDLEDEGWVAPKAKKAKKGGKKKVLVATRTSNRIPRDGVSIAAKAMARAKTINDISGKKVPPNPFTVLNSASNEELFSVINDLDISLNNHEEQINVFKAEELARPAIAEANYKAFLEKQNSKGCLNKEDDLEELNLCVISNESRNQPSVSSKGGENSRGLDLSLHSFSQLESNMASGSSKGEECSGTRMPNGEVCNSDCSK